MKVTYFYESGYTESRQLQPGQIQNSLDTQIDCLEVFGPSIWPVDAIAIPINGRIEISAD